MVRVSRTAVLVAALLVAGAVLAGCVDAPKPAGMPGTKMNPASGIMYVFLRNDTIRPKLTWVTEGTNVVFEDHQGAAHELWIKKPVNQNFTIPANGSLTFAALEVADLRLVCNVHKDLDMSGWLYVVPRRAA